MHEYLICTLLTFNMESRHSNKIAITLGTEHLILQDLEQTTVKSYEVSFSPQFWYLILQRDFGTHRCNRN